MFDRLIVKKALRNILMSNDYPVWTHHNKPAKGQSSIISLLIHDIFGGEIMKTHKKRGWHFYNRIDNECIDFSRSEMSKSSLVNHFENIPSNPDETYEYFEQEDYSTFYIEFIRAFEKAVRHGKYRSDYAT